MSRALSEALINTQRAATNASMLRKLSHYYHYYYIVLTWESAMIYNLSSWPWSEDKKGNDLRNEKGLNTLLKAVSLAK